MVRDALNLALGVVIASGIITAAASIQPIHLKVTCPSRWALGRRLEVGIGRLEMESIAPPAGRRSVLCGAST